MALPKIMYPQFDILIPSRNKKMKFRQLLVKEEKILLTAKASEDDSDILTAINQVVQNCSMDDSFDVNKITTFDLEYIFIKLRGLSISNKVNLTFKDLEDDKLYEFEVDLDKVELNIPKNVNSKIMINDKMGLVLKYPSASIYADKQFFKSTIDETTLELIIRCIDKVFDGDSVYDTNTSTREEIIEFLDQLDVKTFEKINDYLTNVPKVRYEIKYKNSLNHDRTIVLSTINDFFTLR